MPFDELSQFWPETLQSVISVFPVLRRKPERKEPPKSPFSVRQRAKIGLRRAAEAQRGPNRYSIRPSPTLHQTVPEAPKQLLFLSFQHFSEQKMPVLKPLLPPYSHNTLSHKYLRIHPLQLRICRQDYASWQISSRRGRIKNHFVRFSAEKPTQ